METQATKTVSTNIQIGFYQEALTPTGETARAYFAASYWVDVVPSSRLSLDVINVQQYLVAKYGNPCNFSEVTKEDLRKEVSALIEGDGLNHFGVLDFDGKVWPQEKI